MKSFIKLPLAPAVVAAIALAPVAWGQELDTRTQSVVPIRALTYTDLSRLLGFPITQPDQLVLARDGNIWRASELLALANQMERDLAARGRSLLNTPGQEIEMGDPLTPAEAARAFRHPDAPYTYGGGEIRFEDASLTRPYAWSYGDKKRLQLFARGKFVGKGGRSVMTGESQVTLGGAIYNRSRDLLTYSVSGTAKKQTPGKVKARVTLNGKDVYLKEVTGEAGKWSFTDKATVYEANLFSYKWPVDIGPITARIEVGMKGALGIDYVVGTTSWNPTVESIHTPSARLDAWGSAGGSYLGFGVKIKIDLDPLLGYSAPHTLAAYTVPSEQRLRARLDHDIEALRGKLKLKLETPFNDWSWTLWELDGYHYHKNAFDETLKRRL